MEDDDDGDSGGGEGWLVSFADLMTLLFAAFVVLYGSLEVGTTDRIFGYTAAIRESFVEVPDFVKDDQEIGDIKKGLFVFKAFEGETDIKGAKKAMIKQDPKISYDHDKNRVDRLLDQIAMTENGIDFGLRRAMNTEDHEKGFTIKLAGAYFFKANSYRFSRDGRKRFLELGKLLKALNRPMLIEGHTDSMVSKKGFNNNALGALRASNAARLLSRELGIPSTMIETISYGPSRPIASNKTDKGRKKNRRIEIKYFNR